MEGKHIVTTPHPDLLEDPGFQDMISEALKTLDFAAQCSDDNRLEVQYKRNGTAMSIVVEERNED